MTEREKMVLGLPYIARDPELTRLRIEVRKILGKFNQAYLLEEEELMKLQGLILPNLGKGSFIEPPFYCDYGWNIHSGEEFYMNFDGVILDVAEVNIGHKVLCGPKVQILTATHSLNAEERHNSNTEFAKPIHIGNEVWIGAGAIICPGVKIGNQVVIGAGSIVTKDIPDGVLAVGNPCRIIKKID